jgi:hypothetical protein
MRRCSRREGIRALDTSGDGVIAAIRAAMKMPPTIATVVPDFRGEE